jgi:hypothetical protein
MLALSLLNGLYSQTYSSMPSATQSHQSNVSSHEMHYASSEHMTHETAKHDDCGLDGACKTQCAWQCQLSQAMQPLPVLLNVPVQIVNQLPTYQPRVALVASLDQGLRPPISI